MQEHIRSRIVVDTNVLLDNLGVLESLVGLSEAYKHVVVIPCQVTRELSGLKLNPKVAKLAKKATKYLDGVLAKGLPGLVRQRKSDKLDKGAVKDDAILDCCMWFKQAGYTSILLSNDAILCVKALAEHVPTVTYRRGLQAIHIATMIAKEAGVAVDLPDVEMTDMEDDDGAADDPHTNHTARYKVPHKQDGLLVPSWPSKNKPNTPLELSWREKAPARDPQTCHLPQQISITKLPPPRVLEYSKYKLLATLEDHIFETLIQNARSLSLYQMQRLMPHGLTGPSVEATTQSLARLYTGEFYPIFALYLSRSILEDFQRDVYPRKPSRKSRAEFIEFWGQICLSLAMNDYGYRKMYTDVVKVTADFFTPPLR